MDSGSAWESHHASFHVDGREVPHIDMLRTSWIQL
jgi:hypothetical protein